MEFDKKLSITAFTITALMAVVTYLFSSTGSSVALLAGGLIALANFRLSADSLKKIFAPALDAEASKGLAIIAFIFRYSILGAILLFSIKSGLDPVFFLIGLSSVVGAIFISFNSLKEETA